MTSTAITPYIAMLITVIVWALTQRANQRHEIFKERLRKRVDMFDGLLPEISRFVVALNLNNENELNEKTARLQESIDKFGNYRIQMLCYAKDNERQAYEAFVNAIDSRNIDTIRAKNKILVDLVRQNLRLELGLK